MKEKQCRKCEQVKPVEAFYRIMNKDRYQHVCIECMAAKRKKTVSEQCSEAGKRGYMRYITHDLTGRDY